jgi:hypothetical protein
LPAIAGLALLSMPIALLLAHDGEPEIPPDGCDTARR